MDPAGGITVEELLAQSSWLQRLAASLVAGNAAADDLVQETWALALERPPREASALRPWLARVARNLALNMRRGAARRAAHESAVAPAEPELDPARIAEELEAQRVLAEAVLRLEEPLRTAIVLRWFRGLDSASIGRAQRVPAGTVRWRLKRALELLRADLDRRFGDRSAWLAFLAPLSVERAPLPVAPWTGVTLMSATTKIAILAAGVLATLAGVWFARGTGETPAVVVQASARDVARESHPAPGATTSEPPARLAERESLAVASAEPVAEPVERECCIVGRVLDSEGRAVAGAQVLARPAQLAQSLRSRTRLDEERLVTTSGAGGVYTLAVPGRRPFVLTAMHGELAPGYSLHAFAGERRDLTLAPGTVLAVQAQDEGGTPLADVLVRATFDTPAATGALWSAETTTGADGRAELRGLPAGKGRVDGRQGLLRGERAITADGTAPATCTLVLYGTGRVEGRVFERDTGRPIAGARVGGAHRGVDEAVTDAAGRYAIDGIGLGDGLWVLEAHARGRAGRFELVRLTLEGDRRTVDFALDPAVRVVGRVLDAERRAIAGARVVFLGSQPVEPYTAALERTETTTDALGAFAVDDALPEVAYRVLALAPGHATGLFACGPVAPGSTAIDLGELVVGTAATIAGEVAGFDHEGPWDIELHWAGANAATRFEPFSLVDTTRADSRGRFAFAELQPDRYRLVLLDPATKRAGLLVEQLVDLAPGEQRSAVLQTDARTIRGALAAGGKIRCTVRLFALAEPALELRATTTDGDGRFRLSAPEPGPFRVVLDDVGLQYESRTIEPVEAGTTDLVVELVEFHSTHVIRGVVTVDGAPAPDDLFISFWSSCTGQRVARVAFLDADGQFAMEDLRDEPYDVGVLDFDGRYEPVRIANVRPDGEELELVLVPKR